MGRVKAEWMESQERGWDAPDKSVCPDCVKDDFLKGIIEISLDSRKCSYCGKGSKGYIAAHVEAIMPAISSGLHHYFNDPDSAGVPYDNGYVFEPNITTEDALESISLECHEELFSDIANSFHNTLWTETAEGSWAGTHLSDIMRSAWKRFVNTVKHECRYFFSLMPSDDVYHEELSPTDVLKAVGSMVSQLELISTLPSDTMLFRVRIRDQNSTWSSNAEQLGPPQNERAGAGRMNPAGISYFYLALDQQTAFAEVVNKPPCMAISASFKTRKNLLVLDLCNLPAIPSIFDEDNHNQREWMYFLQEFVHEISSPTVKNGQEHIDYVASQIVSEYFAKEFRTEDGLMINGLKYPSAVRPGGINVVLFPPPNGHKAFVELAEFANTKEHTFNDWYEFFSRIT